MKIKDTEFVEVVKRLKQFEERLFKHPLANESDLPDLYSTFKRKEELGTKLKTYKADLKAAMSLLQMDELKARKKVLRRIGYCNTSDVIELKGRVACELSSGEELLMTELIFEGVFNNLTVAQSVALLSCFVCDEKSSEMPKLTDELSGESCVYYSRNL